jgi:YjbE family integral membrane protein
LRAGHAERELEAEEVLEGRDLDEDGQIAEHAPRKALAQAAWQIVVADVSMSLDNVLAVAGAAREHPVVLVFGLGFSIALMGIAASFIARLLQKYHWIAYVGLAVILYVAIEMIYRSALEAWPAIAAG